MSWASDVAVHSTLRGWECTSFRWIWECLGPFWLPSHPSPWIRLLIRKMSLMCGMILMKYRRQSQPLLCLANFQITHQMLLIVFLHLKLRHQTAHQGQCLLYLWFPRLFSTFSPESISSSPLFAIVWEPTFCVVFLLTPLFWLPCLLCNNRAKLRPLSNTFTYRLAGKTQLLCLLLPLALRQLHLL